MGTTLAALLVLGDQVVVTHVGDSRVYRFRGDRLERLTTDHSMVAELEAALGEVTPAMRRAFGHIVTRHIGVRGPADPECKVFAGEPGDRFLICTDGVTDGLDDEMIERTFREAGSAAEACDAIVSRASEAGADDNITAVVVELS
jgi:protein phosphatase